MSSGQATEDEISRFFRLSQDLLSIVGADGYLKRVNAAWEATLHFSPQELLAQPLAEFAHPGGRERLIFQFQNLQAGDSSVSFESRLRSRDGAYHRLQWNAVRSGVEDFVYA